MERLPRLDARLLTIASMVREGARCADIGCDHGYLVAWLAAQKKISAGYACDINRKPLEKAAFTLSEYGVADRVKLILCAGLDGLPAGGADDIVIAGMGGDLIWEIIGKAPWTRDPALRFVLQPMTKSERLRRSLAENGFAVLREDAVVSGNFPYTVMQAAYAGRARTLTPAEAYCGTLLDDPSPAARQYLSKTARLIRERVEGLERAAAPGPEYEELRALLKELESRCTA